MKLINEKKSYKYYGSIVREHLEIVPFFTFLRTCYSNSMSLGFPGKSAGGMEVVSNGWQSIRSLFRVYILLGSRDMRVQSFDHLQHPKMIGV